jgi:hypothetical protein
MSATFFVPQVSHCPTPYSVGQWDNPPESGTPCGTEKKASSLKALAAKVLQSVPPGTNGGTDGGTGQNSVGQKADYTGSFVPRPKPSGSTDADTERTPLRARTREDSAPVLLPDAPPLDALARFERDPCGVVFWLAQQSQGQPWHLSPRWVAVIQAEARLRLQEVEA